jgi:uncharacterized protein
MRDQFRIGLFTLCVFAAGLAVSLFAQYLPSVRSGLLGSGHSVHDAWPQSVRAEIGTSTAPVVAQSVPGGGYSFPALTDRVVDNAGLLPPADKSALIAKLKAFEDRSSDQVVVATIASLDGANLEDFANQLFRHWQLGQADEDNGVLLLVARGDRKIRIEVGYGLEGILTDALSRLVIENVIVPKFRAGDFAGGIVEGADAIIEVLSGDAAELEARYRRVQENRDWTDDVDWFQVAFFTIWAMLFFGPLAAAILWPLFGKKTGKHTYRWLGIDMTVGGSSGRSGRGGGWSSGGGGWSGGGGGFSGGGGSSGGGGASGGW